MIIVFLKILLYFYVLIKFDMIINTYYPCVCRSVNEYTLPIKYAYYKLFKIIIFLELYLSNIYFNLIDY